jgi:2-polyprenyl-6-methoxyphenol hydroxylase-like FAD-dependent oxidoreductase
LAKKGVKVQIIDAADAMDTQPRATHFAAPAVDELRRAGVLEDIMKEGFHPDGVQWRRIDGSLLGGIYSGKLPEEKQVVCLPLDKVSKIILRHVQEQSTAQIKWSHKVVNVGQDENVAWVEVETPDGLIKMSASYIVGCDGANSQVRRSLFGDWNFPGRTWDEQIVATNVSIPVLELKIIYCFARHSLF